MTTPRQAGDEAYDAAIAASYEEDRQHERIWGVEQAYMERAVAAMPVGATVLDLPVGTGRFIPAYQARQLRVLGLDISQAMLDQARARVTAPGIELRLGDARAIDAPDASFDYVVCWRLLHLLSPDDAREIIAELARVTRGTLLLQAYVRDGWHPWLRLRSAVVRRVQALRPRKAAPASASPWAHIRSYAHVDSELRATCRACGLTVQAARALCSYGTLRLKVFELVKATPEARGGR